MIQFTVTSSTWGSAKPQTLEEKIDGYMEDMDSIKAEQEEVERLMYATYGKFCRLEPELVAKLNALREIEKGAYADPEEVEEFEHVLETFKEVTHAFEGPISQCRDLVPVGPLVDHEVKKARHVERDQYRTMIRTCLQICHPDKVHKHSSTVRKKLLAMFHDIRELQEERDDLRLVVVYIKVHRLVGRELSASAQQMIQPLLMFIDGERRLLQDMMCQPLYEVYEADASNDTDKARVLFRFYIKEEINRLQSQI